MAPCCGTVLAPLSSLSWALEVLVCAAVQDGEPERVAGLD